MLIYIDENLNDFLPFFKPYGRVLLFSPEKDSFYSLNQKKPKSFIISSKTLFFNQQLDPSLTSIQFIGSATSGIDHVSSNWKQNSQLLFANALGCNCIAVSNYIISAIHYLIQKKSLIPNQKHLGIIGFGHVGQQVLKDVQQLGFKNISIYDPLLNPQEFPTCSLEFFQSQVSIVTLHCSLTKNGIHPSYQFMNQNWISKMRNPFHFINTARGSLTTESFLIENVKNNKIISLILDVFPEEPHLSQELLSHCDLITPHIAGYSLNSKLRALETLLQSFCSHFNFQKPKSIVKNVIENNKMNPKKVYSIEEDSLAFKQQYKKGYKTETLSKLRQNYILREEF